MFLFCVLFKREARARRSEVQGEGRRLIIQDLFFINSLKLLIQTLHLLYHAVVIPELQVQTLWLFDFQSAEVCLERQLLLANSLSALHTAHAQANMMEF